MKEYRVTITDIDGNPLEPPFRLKTTELKETKRWLANRCDQKYGEGNYKISYKKL